MIYINVYRSECILLKLSINLEFLEKGGIRVKRNYWALLVLALIIILQWIGLGFHGQIRFIFLIIILALIILFAILLRK